MFNKRERHFREALTETFNTASGKRVLAHLKMDYVDQTAFNADALVMAYMNGRRDTIQQLVNLVAESELTLVAQQITKIEESNNEY